MPVTLTKSRKLADANVQSGIKAIGIGVYNSTSRLVKTSTGVISLTGVFGSATIARLELKNSTTKFVETGVSGGDNRSVGYNGAITCTFTAPAGSQIDTANLITELTKGEVVLFLEQYDGTIKACGSQNGALATVPIADTGGQIGDMKGYTVTFTTMEGDLSDLYTLTSPAIAEYATALKAYT